MNVDEGVIKYKLQFTATAEPQLTQIMALNAWRRILFLTRLIGQDSQRYNGCGYGNISMRWASGRGKTGFVISGSQTGHIEHLCGRHYAIVTACDPEANRVAAHGQTRPSSEALTHGVVYDCQPAINCVMHAHSPEIWRHAAQLRLAATSASVTYGTPAMAAEVRHLLSEQGHPQQGLFVMGGHDDGIVAFGPSPALAGQILIDHLARALALEAQ